MNRIIYIFNIVLSIFLISSFAFGLNISKTIQDLTAHIQTIVFTLDGTPTGESRVKISGVGGNGNVGGIIMSGNLWVGKGYGNSLYADGPSGKVGIGTTTLDHRLNVAGSIFASENIFTTGKIGIGTFSPNRNLHIKDNQQNAEIDIQSNDSYYRALYHNNTVGNEFRIRSNGSNKFTINSIGNVGIGVDSPNYKLTVLGDIYSNGTLFMRGNNLDQNQNAWPDYSDNSGRAANAGYAGTANVANSISCIPSGVIVATISSNICCNGVASVWFNLATCR